MAEDAGRRTEMCDLVLPEPWRETELPGADAPAEPVQEKQSSKTATENNPQRAPHTRGLLSDTDTGTCQKPCHRAVT